ncbi:hypothetical protein EYF80_027999 [Liparis tanakae]|uniref:Uncharacterized protein n=1 Tax=Liparis tanakae TaxID=230148 RepID=A0A4Z2H785_9TELE|nr:hypothetical protein EYF80_027999 [Liparis tanakae]
MHDAYEQAGRLGADLHAGVVRHAAIKTNGCRGAGTVPLALGPGEQWVLLPEATESWEHISRDVRFTCPREEATHTHPLHKALLLQASLAQQSRLQGQLSLRKRRIERHVRENRGG